MAAVKACVGGTADVRHNFHAFIPDVMEPTYSKKDLDALKADKHITEFEGVKYDHYQATQEQRRIERAIRAQKRRIAASTNETDEQAARTKMKRLYEKYEEFSKAAGLRMQKERANVYIPGVTK